MGMPLVLHRGRGGLPPQSEYKCRPTMRTGPRVGLIHATAPLQVHNRRSEGMNGQGGQDAMGRKRGKDGHCFCLGRGRRSVHRNAITGETPACPDLEKSAASLEHTHIHL